MLVSPPVPTGEAITRVLAGQGDQVRIIETIHGRAEVWKRLGAFVATAEEVDASFVERAAQNVRTVVLFDDAIQPAREVVEGAAAAGVERAVLVSDRTEGPVVDVVTGYRQHVVIATGKGRFRRGAGPEAVAAAVDAADDLAGDVRLILDLGRKESWAELELEGPVR